MAKTYHLQPLLDIAEICYRLGAGTAVLSPGSRCAPLAAGFTAHQGIKTFTFSDERAAAYVALGMAQQQDSPVVLVCTSGTAAANYAPAVAEAFYQKVPLVLLTADRPPEWIDQQDGQAIRQQGLYGQHTAGAWQLPVITGHPDESWQVCRVLSEAIDVCRNGPVHINVPVREPFYPEAGVGIKFSQQLKVTPYHPALPEVPDTVWRLLRQEWPQSGKVLLVAGQQQALWQIDASECPLPVVSDIMSNLHRAPLAITRQDSFLPHLSTTASQRLKPDLLISFGGSVVSKNLKLFLRRYKPAAHWHIQAEGRVADTFQSLTRVLRTTPKRFLEQLPRQIAAARQDKSFAAAWQQAEKTARDASSEFFKEKPEGEFAAVSMLMKILPQQSCLHLANSMAVRYANFAGLEADQQVQVFSNRGTSGIDGCTSTTTGHSLAAPDKLHVLVTGDLAFFYDRNGLWHNYNKSNLRILLLNNQGGSIFRMIPGPDRLQAFEDYFVTRQPLQAEGTATDAGMEYRKISTSASLLPALKELLQPGGTGKILEINDPSKENTLIFGQFKSHLKRAFGHF